MFGGYEGPRPPIDSWSYALTIVVVLALLCGGVAVKDYLEKVWASYTSPAITTEAQPQ